LTNGQKIKERKGPKRRYILHSTNKEVTYEKLEQEFNPSTRTGYSWVGEEKEGSIFLCPKCRKLSFIWIDFLDKDKKSLKFIRISQKIKETKYVKCLKCSTIFSVKRDQLETYIQMWEGYFQREG